MSTKNRSQEEDRQIRNLISRLSDTSELAGEAAPLPEQVAPQSAQAPLTELQEKFAALEQWEKDLRRTYEQLRAVYDALSAREAALKQKEETLNTEYLKILKLESMYHGLDRFSDSLNSVLPSLNTDEINSKEVRRKMKEDEKKNGKSE